MGGAQLRSAEEFPKIKDSGAREYAEDIAKSLDVTVGSLQVTCSRLRISLRRHDNAPRDRLGSRTFSSIDLVYRAHLQRESTSRANFQLVLKAQGTEQATDLAFTTSDVARIRLEASAQGLGMTDLTSQVLTQALKKGLSTEIGQEEVVYAAAVDPGAEAGRGWTELKGDADSVAPLF